MRTALRQALQLSPARSYTGHLPPPGFQQGLTSIVPDRGAGVPTFTRATTKTFTDWEGIVRTVLSGEACFQGARRVQNLIVGSSTDITNVNWGGSGHPATANDATHVTFTQQFDNWRNAIVTIAGHTYVMSFDLQVITGNTALNFFVENSPSGPGIPLAASTTRRRYSVPCLGRVGGGVINFGIQDQGISGFGQVLFTNVLVEDVTGQSNQNPSDHVLVGAVSPFQGAGVDGVQYFSRQNGNTVAANVVTAGSGPAIASTILLGYNAEEPRTNEVLQSRDLSNASWTKTNVTAAKDQTGADGIANSASSLLSTLANGTVTQAIASASNVARRYSVYMKRITGVGNIDLTMDNGVGWTTVSGTINGATYTRVAMGQTLANPTVGFRIVASGDKVAVDFIQEEAGPFDTSAIPTTTVAVARNGDDLSYPTSGNILSGSGTSSLETTAPTATTQGNLISSNAGNAVALFIDPTGHLAAFDGPHTPSYIVVGARPYTTVQKVATRWDGALGQGAANGSLGVAATLSALTLSASMSIGCNPGATLNGNGTIRNARIWQRAQNDRKLVNITR